MARRRSNSKVANSIVAMGSAAVMAVYSAGFIRTRPAADKIAAAAIERRIERETPPEAPASSGPVAPPAKLSPAPKVSAPRKPKQPQPSPAEADPPAAAPASEPSSAPAAPVSAIEPPPAASIVPEKPAEAAPAPPTPPAPPPVVLRDGKYQGWGSCRHGDIQVTVVIEGGRIASAAISDCQTRYPCYMIEDLPGQVVWKQTANVRAIGGVTESSDAYYWAVIEALKQAK